MVRPASTASRNPAQATEGAKAAKKTSNAAPAGYRWGEEEERKKVRKETHFPSGNYAGARRAGCTAALAENRFP
jgi:hypothetical protein